jgi:MFS family permease
VPAIATAYLRKLRLFSRDVRLYLITSAMLGFCGIGTHRLLFSLYLLRLGYGPEFIGLVAAVGTLANAAVSLPAGAFGRRWGNRSGMIVGMTLMVAGLGLPALVELIPTSLWVGWLLVTGSLIWAGMSVYSVNASHT